MNKLGPFPPIKDPEEVALYLHKSISWVYKNWRILGGRKLRGSLFFPSKEELYERLFHKGEGVEDVLKVILAADPETQDYLYTLRETMARVNEVNQLTLQDVDFDGRYVVLYTRKKKGGTGRPERSP